MIKKKTQKSIRLPSHISPISYKLTIRPDLESFTFSGNEIIKINIGKNINKLTLHSKDIDIETASICYKNKDREAKVKNIKQFTSKIIYDTKLETATLYFKNKINNNGELHLYFKGILNENLRGLYRSKYTLDGEEKHMATTQFEATDARRAFPCFDEPAHKATFKVSLIVADKHTAISNTLPTDIREHSAGYKIVSFAPTPKMSTYLLAFIVGEFDFVEGITTKPAKEFLRSGSSSSLIRGPKNSFAGFVTPVSAKISQTQVRVFTTKGKSHQAKFALEVAIKSLEFYNEYFDIPYPLPTLDLIAIPDFESAAMENWGAITFRETAILVDEEKTSLSNKQWVAIVIAHEIAHQWFGNLVTMKWWTDLWLNEGFASYMENFCVDTMFPEWNVWDLYIADRYAVALRLDALSNSHPIEIKVNNPEEISEIFDMVSYAKGSAMIRQLAEYIGHDKFRSGLQHYLKKHSYKNTNTVDLWDSFEKISKKPVNKMMSLWTKETGYPLVSVFKKKNEFYLSQERFFSSRISAKEYSKSTKKKNLWPIPIKYEGLSTLENCSAEIMNLLMTKKTVPLIGASIGKINKEEDTFMRVRYDDITLEKLSGELKKNSLSTRDRLGIIRDLFALAEGGYIKTDIAMSFALNYKNEKEYIVWAEIASGIRRVYNLISTESVSNKCKNYALSLYSPLAEKMGFEKISGEKNSNTFLRNLAISQAAFYGDKKIINKAIKLFKNRKETPIRADMRSIIYSIVAANGIEKDWKIFEKLYRDEKMHEEKERFGYALTAFKNKDLLKKTLAFAISGEVRDHDVSSMIAMVWQNKNGQELAWNYVKNNWNMLLKKYGEGGHFISRIIGPLGTHATLKDLKDAKKFFAKNATPGAERALKQSYEKIESNAAWIKDDIKIIQKWLAKNY
ncbi:MAG: M1 family metallopeptidase [Candidatus Pacebacteria bacterium]|nr:M1 family metallopeptidase [Candidatus Paceibacterota bacterium]